MADTPTFPKPVPIEKDPRYLRLIKNYKYKVQKHKSTNAGIIAAVCSLVTSPLYTIAISM